MTQGQAIQSALSIARGLAAVLLGFMIWFASIYVYDRFVPFWVGCLAFLAFGGLAGCLASANSLRVTSLRAMCLIAIVVALAWAADHFFLSKIDPDGGLQGFSYCAAVGVALASCLWRRSPARGMKTKSA